MASMTEKDYYAILGVDEKATTDEIRKAFQQKARKLHPDVNKEPDAEERFKEVSEAYAVLSDTEKRARYDQMRSGVPFSGYPGGTTGHYTSYGSGFPFGGSGWTSTRTQSRSYNPHEGTDINYTLELDLDTAKAGTKRGITYQRYASCSVCGGMGSVEHSQPTTCPTCGGAGRMRIDLGGLGLFGVGFMEVTCPECDGAGKVVVDPCTSCGGSGRVLTASEIIIDIPQNSHDGDHIVKEGMGNAGTNGCEAGDFILDIQVEGERLTARQNSALRIAGFGVPFIVCGLIWPPLMSMLGVGCIITVLGLFLALREGVHANSRWLKQALTSFVGGIASGVILALLVYFAGPLLNLIFPLVLILLFVSMFTMRVR